MSTKKDKEERRLKKAKINLMRQPKFALWSGLLMVGNTQIRDDIPTAATDGRNDYYGREFIKELTDKQLPFVVLHETLHKAFRHLHVWRKLYDENPRLANMACDYVINLIIVDYDPEQKYIENPPGLLLDRKFAGLNTKQVYDLLKRQGKGEDVGGGGGGGGGFDHHDWEGADSLSDEEKEKLVRDIDRAIRQGQIAAKNAGEGEGGMPRELEELIQPQVNWKQELAEFVRSTCRGNDMSSWRRLNRRYLPQDIYLPSLRSEKVQGVVVGVDTSGSISSELRAFMSELKDLMESVNPERLDLMYWDTVVAGHEVYDSSSFEALMTSTQPKGGGGTNPACVTTYIKEKNITPDCVIMLTDGQVPNWGADWNAPVLWVVCNNSSAYASNGKTVHINS